jgi:hypothetical protein
MDPYSTHLPALKNAIIKLGGPVLELGSGHFSTPAIRELTNDVITIETIKSWADQMSRDYNDIVYLEDYKNDVQEYLKKDWNVVFVDLYTAEQRTWITPLLENAKCIVCHDTENDYWTETISKFKYVKHFTDLVPHTSYVSNIFDVTQL